MRTQAELENMMEEAQKVIDTENDPMGFDIARAEGVKDALGWALGDYNEPPISKP